MKIGIYGGTFNPIHIGHTSLAKSLIDQGLVDEVWLLVSPLNPFKQSNTSEFAEYHHRYRMAKLAVKNIQGLRASDFENHLPVPSYMYTTLCELSKQYPEHEFSLVIGADNWERFSGWYRSDDLKAKFNILVYRRPGYELDEHNVNIVDTPLYDISSTQLRQAINKGERPKEWLAPNVLRYIIRHKLYSSSCVADNKG